MAELLKQPVSRADGTIDQCKPIVLAEISLASVIDSTSKEASPTPPPMSYNETPVRFVPKR